MSEAGAMTIRTDRLRLRMPDIDDFVAYAEIMASPRSVGMGGPFDLRAAWGMFCHDVALWQLFGHGALMIELGETGECVGQVGINHGPLFPERNWAGSSTRDTRAEAMRPKRRSRCATGPPRRSNCHRSSAISLLAMPHPLPLRSGLARVSIPQHPERILPISFIGTSLPETRNMVLGALRLVADVSVPTC